MVILADTTKLIKEILADRIVIEKKSVGRKAF